MESALRKIDVAEYNGLRCSTALFEGGLVWKIRKASAILTGATGRVTGVKAIERGEMSVSILVKHLIEGVALAVAVGSAAFWFQAARIGLPEGPARDVLQQLRRQGQLNAKAASFSCVSALLQWFALVVWS